MKKQSGERGAHSIPTAGLSIVMPTMGLLYHCEK